MDIPATFLTTLVCDTPSHVVGSGEHCGSTSTLVLQPHFGIRTALLRRYEGHDAAFVLTN